VFYRQAWFNKILYSVRTERNECHMFRKYFTLKASRR